MGKNWVERRAAVEDCLRRNAPQVWQSVRSALQDACKSFREHYATREGVGLTDELENGFRVQISLFVPRLESKRYIIVAFNPNVPAIEWATDGGSKTINISADENEAFLYDDGKRIAPDELSREILEPFLFGKH